MANSLSLAQLLVSPAPTPGAPDAYFDTEVSYTLASAATQVLPVGAYIVALNAHVQIQYQANSTGTLWRNVVPVGTGGFIISDGTNVQLLADSTGGTITLLPKK